ncbi:MAG: methyltransferase domain-containing protein [Alphaproteobacteria bacterium]|nr:methyltransferase domain-containing protein [Alphaproteobacteria bacterium]
MTFKRRLVAQLSRPSGWAAPWMARLLDHFNQKQVRRAIAHLAPAPGGRILELGFGGGVSLPLLLDAVGEGGVVFGADPSAEMIRRARRRQRRALAAGRLELVEAGVSALPWPDDHVDGVMSVNTVYFWPDLEAGLAGLRRLLRPGGRLVLSIGDPKELEEMGFAEAGFRTLTAAQYVEALTGAGFADAEVRAHDDPMEGTCVVGTSP